MPVRTEIRVVLPAPFGPNSPKIYPFCIPRVKGFKAIFPFYPLSVVYRLERALVTSGNAETGAEERSCACCVTEESMGIFSALLTVSLYISAISTQFSPSDCPYAYSAYSASRPCPLLLRRYWRVFSSQGGLLATPYSCCTISFIYTASRNISTHPQRTPMQRESYPPASLKFLIHSTESAQALPRMYMMRLSVNGGQRVSRKGRAMGVGKMTVQMGMPMRVLKIERTYPTMVADLAESMKIWTRAAMESCAIAHPIKMVQRSTQEVLMKKVTQIMYLPAMNMTPAQVRLMMKLTMKQLSQYDRIYNPFIRIICNCRYSFQETRVQSRRGRSRLSPKGQRPDPITFTILLTKVLSQPEKGIYMIEPAITSLLSLPPSLSSRNALANLSIKVNSPSVTRKQVLIVVVCEVFTTILVAPLFLWYQGRRQSLMPSTARMVFLLASRNLTVPSGISVFRSSPRQKASVLAFSRQLMTAPFTESTLLNLGESPPSGQTYFSCVLIRYSAKGPSDGGDQKQYSCWQERPSCGRMSESSKGRERG